MSDILNLSHDDLDRRLAAHALPLPVCELDFVSILLHQLLGGLTVPGVWRVSHLRLMPASGGRRRCVLVSWCSCAQVNDLNPELLDAQPGLYFQLRLQHLIEHIRAGQVGAMYRDTRMHAQALTRARACTGAHRHAQASTSARTHKHAHTRARTHAQAHARTQARTHARARFIGSQ